MKSFQEGSIEMMSLVYFLSFTAFTSSERLQQFVGEKVANISFYRESERT